MVTAAVDATEVYLGLGTNLGDRARNLRTALRALRRIIAIDAVSDIYESDPVGFTDQPRFWNMAVRGRTFTTPLALLHAVKQLERDMGRVPTFRMGPRVIDIDILLYGEQQLDSPELSIPHPALTDRVFVLRPLLDIDANLQHPVTREHLTSHLRSLAPADTMQRLGDAADVLTDA